MFQTVRISASGSEVLLHALRGVMSCTLVPLNESDCATPGARAVRVQRRPGTPWTSHETAVALAHQLAEDGPFVRNSTERREDIHSKRRVVEVRGAVKLARAITHGEASSAGLSQCADLENESKTTNGVAQSQRR